MIRGLDPSSIRIAGDHLTSTLDSFISKVFVTPPVISSLNSSTFVRLNSSRATQSNKRILTKPVVKMSGKPTTPAATAEFSRENLESVLKRRFFYAPAFELYGGVSGLYDYGPPGCSFQANVIDIWRKHFVLEEDMLEVDTTMLTPYEVLKTSGHVDKFSDWMCKDPKSGEIFRADHLVEEVLEARLKGDKEARGVKTEDVEEEDADKKKRKKKVKEIKAVKLEDNVVAEYESVLAQIDGYSGEQLGELMVKYDIKNPATNDPLEPPRAFNLMFETAIGPSGQLKGYLRPETAQGQFLNFNKLYDFNNLKMPFASAAIGKSFRNEISPRAGLLRVREFLMAEIEHFVDPENKKHERFDEVKDIKLTFLPKEVQQSGSTQVTVTTVGEAVSSGLVDNETLGYFLARIYLFLTKIGVDPTRLRFRQHMANEMAHYAADCWDAELQTSYGWIECVGCADRSAYDLTVHSNKTKQKLVVKEKLAEPQVVSQYEIELEKKKFGPKFRKDAPVVEKFLMELSQEELIKYEAELSAAGAIKFTIPELATGEIELDSSFIKIALQTKTVHVREYTPNVIEPSFGIGRIIYSIFEHSFYSRPEAVERGVLSFPPIVAPTKVLLVPLSNNEELQPIVKTISRVLRKEQIPFKVDDSGASIGKRYARNDELGTPFGVTIDFESVKDGSVTLRERDSTKQVRGAVEDVIKAIKEITYEGISWEEGTKNLQPFETKVEDDE
ncbi:hypothetical protein WICPIJ_004872 [Wickerhamomyces pijperi]|uniref:glycine--tRNA ligase n=1 Tax=Wickerhamomyces pijperi TaxID=599730 RepID=A0A9P8Q534_WICPI|nr:hypothetical protein WICPIJ_004872 [Wickerhamomyces pijperi]